ncbi:hypothetical protein CAPTEDRAFT_113876 [Capitella teleta]|uniref:COMM domain-containing protein 1 n=1 Tax=Capitella teleta TaxID=283909 RepID=R7T530_CAPTE|nr:hypothetical protein CAPTEDRAFT_113876 [Capitella teleta]|eukprot:ELT88123.1 hypothetical protein CAPTEDRAFT_113876 [Capitella teleta]
MTDENRNYLGLLNGLARHYYYGDKDITPEYLKSELYQSMNDEEFQHLLTKSRGIIKSMASSDMDSKQSETFLASQVKKKDSNFSESQAKVMLKFWRNHKDRVHESLAQRCIWSDKLKNLSWRIDIQSKGKHVEQINVPTAIVELQLENNTQEEMSEVCDQVFLLIRIFSSIRKLGDCCQIHISGS